jgi:hypothetical protein
MINGGRVANVAPASAGTFRPVRGYVSGDGIFARSGTVPAKAMRCNARMAFVFGASLSEEPTTSCGLESETAIALLRQLAINSRHAIH